MPEYETKSMEVCGWVWVWWWIGEGEGADVRVDAGVRKGVGDTIGIQFITALPTPSPTHTS